MKKFLVGIMVVANLFTSNIYAKEIEKSISVSQIEVMQGIVVEVSDYLLIDTIDGNGWALEATDENDPDSITIEDDLFVGDDVMVIFNNMGTSDIYDDEIIQVIKIQK